MVFINEFITGGPHPVCSRTRIYHDLSRRVLAISSLPRPVLHVPRLWNVQVASLSPRVVAEFALATGTFRFRADEERSFFFW